MDAAKHLIIDTNIVMRTNCIIAITFHVVDRPLIYLRKFIAIATQTFAVIIFMH